MKNSKETKETKRKNGKTSIEGLSNFLTLFKGNKSSASDAARENHFVPTSLFKVLMERGLIKSSPVKAGQKSPTGKIWEKTPQLTAQLIDNEDELKTILSEYTKELRSFNNRSRNGRIDERARKTPITKEAPNEHIPRSSQIIAQIADLKTDFKSSMAELAVVKNMIQHLLNSLGDKTKFE